MFTASLALLREKIDAKLKEYDVQYLEHAFDSGRQTVFIPIFPHVGAKLIYDNYFGREYATKIYGAQRRAAEVGLGPKIGAFIDGFYYNGRRFYGYFTETAEVANELPRNDPRIKDEDMRSGSDFFRDFADTMAMHGLPDWDIFGPNVGFIGDRLVCIDFGR